MPTATTPKTRTKDWYVSQYRALSSEVTALRAELEAKQAEERITWNALKNTAVTVSEETRLAWRDLHRATSLSYQWVSATLDDLRQPVIISK